MIVDHDTDYYVYATGPIDFWSGWMTLDEAADQVEAERRSLEPDSAAHARRHFLDDAEEMLERLDPHFRRAGWEGDYREPVRCGVLPSPATCDSAIMLAIKQDNNGTCFFASPYPLPWLEDRFQKAVVVPRTQLR